MPASEHVFSAESTRNPFRYALAVWRFLRSDTDDNIIPEVAIIEIGFARSRFGRRLARWEVVLDRLRNDPATELAIAEKQVGAPIDLDFLESLEEGSLGQVFAEHCRNRGINPNLIDVPVEQESDWLLNHLFQSHDIWHVLTGWSNDEVGEVGLAGFYCGQLGSPPFFVFLLSLIFLKKVMRKNNDIDEHLSALCSGYRSGRAAKPLVGIDWSTRWELPLDEQRRLLEIDSEEAGDYGQGIMARAA
jgi:ubiquinone biosynthesis protein COQ4